MQKLTQALSLLPDEITDLFSADINTLQDAINDEPEEDNGIEDDAEREEAHNDAMSEWTDSVDNAFTDLTSAMFDLAKSLTDSLRDLKNANE